jgi:hypothetical protein
MGKDTASKIDDHLDCLERRRRENPSETVRNMLSAGRKWIAKRIPAGTR